MKKYLIPTLAVLILLGFFSCNKAKEQADQLIKDSKASYDRAAEEVERVKNKAVKTVTELENAAKEIKEATEAVKEVTK